MLKEDIINPQVSPVSQSRSCITPREVNSVRCNSYVQKSMQENYLLKSITHNLITSWSEIFNYNSSNKYIYIHIYVCLKIYAVIFLYF